MNTPRDFGGLSFRSIRSSLVLWYTIFCKFLFEFRDSQFCFVFLRDVHVGLQEIANGLCFPLLNFVVLQLCDESGEKPLGVSDVVDFNGGESLGKLFPLFSLCRF